MIIYWNRTFFKPLCVSPMTGENSDSGLIMKWTQPFYPPVTGGQWGSIKNGINVMDAYSMDYIQDN